MKQKIFFLYLCAIFSSTSTYVFKLDVLRKWDRNQKRFQHIICFGDFHDKTQSINELHRQYIKDLVNQHKKDCMVIVEDLSSANQHNFSQCNGILINSRGGLLGGLANDLRIDGIPVENVEYRFCRVAALCPLINPNGPHQMCTLTNTITINHIYKEVMEQIERVRNFTDSKSLHVLYKKVARQIEDALRYYKFDQHKDYDVAHFCKKQSSAKHMDEYLKQLCIFDTQLLDMNIMHEIVNTKTQNIFVVVGGSHTTNVLSHLEKHGYEKVYGSDDQVAHASLQAMTLLDNTAEIKKLPPAVDLRVVEKFLK